MGEEKDSGILSQEMLRRYLRQDSCTLGENPRKTKSSLEKKGEIGDYQLPFHEQFYIFVTDELL